MRIKQSTVPGAQCTMHSTQHIVHTVRSTRGQRTRWRVQFRAAVLWPLGLWQVPQDLFCTLSMYTVHCTHCTLYTLYTVTCTYCKLYTLYSVRCTLCTLYTVTLKQCTVEIRHSVLSRRLRWLAREKSIIMKVQSSKSLEELA